MLEVGDLITLSNGHKYIITKRLCLKGKTYLFLIMEDGITEYIICELINDEIEIVRNEKIVKELIQLYIKQGENYE